MATQAPDGPHPTLTTAGSTSTRSEGSDLANLVRAANRIAHGIPGNAPERNLVKLTEETGELARTWTRQMSREAVIEEACDVVITALVAAAFVDATTDELRATLERKIARSMARCVPLGDATDG